MLIKKKSNMIIFLESAFLTYRFIKELKNSVAFSWSMTGGISGRVSHLFSGLRQDLPCFRMPYLLPGEIDRGGTGMLTLSEHYCHH